jgi:hypothetical protein
VSEGGAHIIARTRLATVSVAWQEFPFEWSEQKVYQVRRVFLSGPLAEGVMGLRLPDTSTGCAFESFTHFTPRNVLGRFIARHVFGPKTMRDMRVLVRHDDEHLSGRQPAVRARTLGGSRVATDKSRLWMSMGGVKGIEPSLLSKCLIQARVGIEPGHFTVPNLAHTVSRLTLT